MTNQAIGIHSIGQ
jgi:hypothetical protein